MGYASPACLRESMIVVVHEETITLRPGGRHHLLLLKCQAPNPLSVRSAGWEDDIGRLEPLGLTLQQVDLTCCKIEILCYQVG